MANKLGALRQLIAEKKIDAYIIPGSDAHQSEYIADYWKSRHWFSGFTGSSGLVVVTKDKAGLWTDGRYFIQAEQELSGTGISLFKMNEPGVPTYGKWLDENLAAEATIGFDGRVISVSEFEGLKKDLSSKEISYKYEEDLLGNMWEDRPAMPTAPAFFHQAKFTGKTTSEKLSSIREEMEKERADMYLTAALDEIAWTVNMRGNDIPNTPVVYSYLIITATDAYLFADEQKVAPIKGELAGITILPYDSIFEFLNKNAAGRRLLYNPGGVSVRLFEAIPSDSKNIKMSTSIIGKLKAVKNSTEIENFKNAFIKEGVALVKLLKWLSEVGTKDIFETDIQAKISELRLEQEHCIGDSFTTIAAYGENAALMHYSPKEGSCAKVLPEGLLLVDTGGQYLDGTTDITRTFAVGPVTDEMRRDFTLVLKGHMALAGIKFLEGTTGVQLDVLARQPIWQAAMDYRSGTGHGLGFCLGVHEGPHGISPRLNSIKLTPGMICTNEPGIYKAGRHGIRTENVLLVKEAEKNEFGAFFDFETISFCPIDTAILDKALLSDEEILYLNNYHKQVYDKLSPFLDASEKEWLKNKTKSI